MWRDNFRDDLEDTIKRYYVEGMTVHAADFALGVRPKVRWWPKHVLVRRSYEETAISAPTPFKKAQGALFSFTRDFESNADVWEARGSVMMPLKVLEEDLSRASGVASFSIMPSISFDRIANTTDETKEH